MQDRAIHFDGPKLRHYELLKMSPNAFAALLPTPGSMVVLATLPMEGYAIIERPRAAVRAGRIVIDGLTWVDAIMRVRRANDGKGLEMHRWS